MAHCKRLPPETHQTLKDLKGYSYGAILKCVQQVYCKRIQASQRCPENCQECAKDITEKAQTVRKFYKNNGSIIAYWRVCMHDLVGEVMDRPVERPIPTLEIGGVKVLP